MNSKSFRLSQDNLISFVVNGIAPWKVIPEGVEVIGMELDRIDHDLWNVKLHFKEDEAEVTYF